jgi:serine protease Do
MEGRFIGINSAHLLRGYTIAIPHGTLSGIVETLLRHGRMRRGFLGVVARPVRLPASLAAETGQGAGPVLLSVEDGSAANEAGLLVGDVLLSIGDKAVSTLEGLLFRLGETEPGTNMKIALLRGGKPLWLQAVVGERD